MITFIISLIFFIPNVFAVTLSEALTQAYKNNPELNAERENLKVSEEELKISKSDYMPSLTISGSKSKGSLMFRAMHNRTISVCHSGVAG